MKRKIEPVVSIRRIGEEEPLQVLPPAQTLAEIEELRRMFRDWTGDPDQPMVPVVTIRRISDASGT